MNAPFLRTRARPSLVTAAVMALLGSTGSAPAEAQIPFPGEVRQLVTFSFQPGGFAQAMEIYTDEALPLYRNDSAMRALRGLREVESPIPLDLVLVRSFAGMAGMDESNAQLRRLAAASGQSIGAIYGRIGAVATSHDDQFVEMLPELGAGDPTAEPLVALVWYQTLAGEQEQFERTLADVVVWEGANGITASTGRFLLSDGWTHLRLLGFASLAAYEAYWSGVRSVGAHDYLEGITGSRRQVILAPVPELSVH